MPVITFLVAVNLDTIDPLELLNVSTDMQEDLEHSGHDVISVHPWARPTVPTAQPAGGFTSLSAPDPNSI